MTMEQTTHTTKPLAILIEPFAGCTLERDEIERCAQAAAHDAVIRHAFAEMNRPCQLLMATCERIRNQVNSVENYPQNRNPERVEHAIRQIRSELSALIDQANVIGRFAGMNEIEEKPF